MEVKRLKACLFLLGVLSVCLWWCFAPLAQSQDTAGALVEKLKALSAQLRQQRERLAGERRLLDNRNSLLLEEIETLKQREKQLGARRDVLEEESEKLAENLQKLVSEGELLSQQRIEAEKLIGEKAAVLVNHINAGLPLDAKARKDTVGNLIGSGETPADELKLLWQLYMQEYRRAGEIEMGSPVASREAGAQSEGAGGVPANTVELSDGRKLQGRVLRVGTVGVAFLSDDGDTAAVLVKTAQGYAWHEVGTHGELAELRRAFEIAAGRRAPQIVNFPLQLNTQEGGK